MRVELPSIVIKLPEMDITGCELDSEGNILDSITCEPIPTDKVVVVREGNGAYCFNVETLLRSLVMNGDNTNPFTRSKLPQEVLERIEKYRASTSKTITVMDTRMNTISAVTKREVSIIDTVGDLVITCVESIAPLPEILTVSLKCKGCDMSTLDFNTPVGEFESAGSIAVAVTSGGSRQPVSPLGEKIKEYASSNSRYQYISAFHARFVPSEDEEDGLERALMEFIMLRVMGLPMDEQPSSNTQASSAQPPRSVAQASSVQPSSGFGTRPTSAQPSGFSARPTSSAQPSSGFGTRPTSSQPSSGFGTRPTSTQSSGLGTRPTSAQPSGFGTRPTSTQSSGFGTRPTSSQPSSGFGTRPTSAQPSGFGTRQTSSQPSPDQFPDYGQSQGRDYLVTITPVNNYDHSLNQVQTVPFIPPPRRVGVPLNFARQNNIGRWLPSWHSPRFLQSGNYVWYPLMDNYSPRGIDESTRWTLLDKDSVSQEVNETNINVAIAYDIAEQIATFNECMSHGSNEGMPDAGDYPMIEPAIHIIRHLGLTLLPNLTQ